MVTTSNAKIKVAAKYRPKHALTIPVSNESAVVRTRIADQVQVRREVEKTVDPTLFRTSSND